jgi:tRNA threonylcarbamoyladenosine biosynthesis protein TsaE
MVVFVSNSPQETMKFAAEFLPQLKGGDILALKGELGVGKTVFCKGLAQALGVREQVTSPTFVLCCEYVGDIFNLVHIDAYRLQGVDIEETGILEVVGALDSITVVEWAEYIGVSPQYIVDFRYEQQDIRIIEVKKLETAR